MEEKINIKIGCADYLVNEVESLRDQNKLLGVQVEVMNSFFNLIDRIGDTKKQGYSEDRLYQAKREIREAKEKLESK